MNDAYKSIYKLETDYEKIYTNIIEKTKQYVDKNNIKSLVVGLSGGIDSALVVALASSIPVRIIGHMIPIVSNKEDEMRRAEKIAYAFCTEHKIVDMSALYYQMADFLKLPKESDDPKVLVAKGNIKARLRMMDLYDTAGRNNGMVLSTDNFTEWLLGFWTLHGDVGDYGMIQQLWKTEVYGLSEYIVDKLQKDGLDVLSEALQLCIDATPTDGLGITNSDFDQIMPDYDRSKSAAYNYKLVDLKLINYLAGDNKDVDNPVIKRHLASAFKRINPYSIPRQELVG